MSDMPLDLYRRGAAEPAVDRFGEESFVSLIRKIGAEPTSDERWRQLLAEIVVATASHAVRDAAALALVDREGSDYVDALLQAIRRPDLAGHKGTLLFALDELGGAIPLEVVVQLIEQGSYEATAEALLFFEDDRVIVPSDPASVRSLRDKLRALRASADPSVSEAAEITLARGEAWLS